MYKESIKNAVGRIWPMMMVRYDYYRTFGRLPNVRNPRDLNEKTIYLAYHTDTAEWSRLADKYRVRDYVKQCGLEHLLVPLIGVWDSPDDIDFAALTLPCVIKANHSENANVVVEADPGHDYEALRQRVRRNFNRPFGYSTGEKHYTSIPRKIIAEKMLPAADQAYESTSIIDYKIFCINGEPHTVMVLYDREAHGGKTMMEVKDSDWNSLDSILRETRYITRGDGRAKNPPLQFENMKSAARKLAAPFPLVRVDFYEVAGKLYFGEMTFTTSGFCFDVFTPGYLAEMGAAINMPQP